MNSIILRIETKPYSCDDMVWDSKLRMYKLTSDYIKQFIDIRYKNDEEFNREMSRISMNMYDYCYTESCKTNDAFRLKRDTLKYRFAKDHKMRDSIKQALLKFVKFDDATNGGTNANYFGMDNAYKDNIVAFLESEGLINRAKLAYQYDIEEEGAFDEQESS